MHVDAHQARRARWDLQTRLPTPIHACVADPNRRHQVWWHLGGRCCKSGASVPHCAVVCFAVEATGGFVIEWPQPHASSKASWPVKPFCQLELQQCPACAAGLHARNHPLKPGMLECVVHRPCGRLARWSTHRQRQSASHAGATGGCICHVCVRWGLPCMLPQQCVSTAPAGKHVCLLCYMLCMLCVSMHEQCCWQLAMHAVHVYGRGRTAIQCCSW